MPFIRSDLHSFRVAHPLVRRTSWSDVTAVGILAIAAMALWLVVLPLEIAGALLS